MPRMNTFPRCFWLALAVLAALTPVNAPAKELWQMDGTQYEEPAGATLGGVFSPTDDIYGGNLSWGMWLKNTPVFGDYFLTLFQNGIEDAFYTGGGLTLRIMPHCQFAPFIGGGGSYNFSASGSSDTVEPAEPGEPVLTDRGASYGAGHAEVGLRVSIPNRLQLLEILGRYTWSALDGDRDYAWVGLSIGTGF
jgi:hypothetical protein